MTTGNEAIISIHPRHAQAILDGAKTVELRRRIPTLAIGTRLWIYATRPLGAVIGAVTVAQSIRGEPEEIWQNLGSQTCIEYREYEAYFEGALEAIALILAEPERSPKCIAIQDLRDLRHGFHPPQVLTRISSQEAQSLRRMAMA